ncbi:MAG: hypothetical protein M3137_08360, partial [Actinomycetota bacterium]|nr:hypothetical protein [Actinomycetota bacterium]
AWMRTLPTERRVCIDGVTLVVNVGVLGRPANDGSRDVWYSILGIDQGHASCELVSLSYDWATHARPCAAPGYPRRSWR